MTIKDITARKGLTMAVFVIVIALGTGHVMQTVLSETAATSDLTPVVPVAPDEAQIPVVLKTPPPLRLPGTVG